MYVIEGLNLNGIIKTSKINLFKLLEDLLYCSFLVGCTI